MKERGGFTLLELLVSIGIVLVLAGILLPTLVAAKQRGLLTSDDAALRQVGLALMLYNEDHEGHAPYWTALEDANPSVSSVARAALDPFPQGALNSDYELSGFPEGSRKLTHPVSVLLGLERPFLGFAEAQESLLTRPNFGLAVHVRGVRSERLHGPWGVLWVTGELSRFTPAGAIVHRKRAIHQIDGKYCWIYREVFFDLTDAERREDCLAQYP